MSVVDQESQLEYSLLQPQDAELLAAGLRRVYGDSYPIGEFYDPAYVADLISAGKLFTVVARNTAGDVVAQMSTVLERRGDVTADGSALMVASEYRGLGATAQLGWAMSGVYQDQAICGLHLYALALHDRVQRKSGEAGAVVTGVLPAWFSRSARVDGYPYPAGRRIGAVCLYMPLAALPDRRVILPSAYADLLAGIYRRLPAERELLAAGAAPLRPGPSQLRRDDKPGNGLRRLVVDSAGADLPRQIEELAASGSSGIEVQLLDLSLSDERIDHAVRLARRAGFCFGALMVDRCGTDYLRLQRYDDSLVSPEAMVIASPEAQALLEQVLLERGELRP